MRPPKQCDYGKYSRHTDGQDKRYLLEKEAHKQNLLENMYNRTDRGQEH